MSVTSPDGGGARRRSRRVGRRPPSGTLVALVISARLGAAVPRAHGVPSNPGFRSLSC
jgi:hypothetical protein